MKVNGFKLILTIAIALLACACGNKKDEAYTGNMKFRPLGNTGIDVSEIGIGCGVFEELDTAQSRAYMDVALDSGINYIDIYTADPKVRDNIGYALKGRRDKMNIQGHIGCYWNTELKQYERTREVEMAKVGFEDLLKRLGTDHIEVGMMHIFDDMADWDSVQNSPYLDYVKQLKGEGKIKHIGMSSHNAEVALAAAKSGYIEVIMFSLNPVFDRLPSGVNAWGEDADKQLQAGIDPVHVQLYDYCAQHHIAIVVMKAFGGGGRLLDAEKSLLHKALTPVQCLAYCLDKPCVSVALCGTSNIEQLVEDLHYINASDKEKDYKDAIAVTQPVPTTADKRPSEKSQPKGSNCTYCGHCSPCPAGIDIAKVNQLLDKTKGSKSVPAKVKNEYKALEHHASECVGCGKCEQRCPFDVPVRQQMQEAVKTFGY